MLNPITPAFFPDTANPYLYLNIQPTPRGPMLRHTTSLTPPSTWFHPCAICRTDDPSALFYVYPANPANPANPSIPPLLVLPLPSLVRAVHRAENPLVSPPPLPIDASDHALAADLTDHLAHLAANASANSPSDAELLLSLIFGASFADLVASNPTLPQTHIPSLISNLAAQARIGILKPSTFTPAVAAAVQEMEALWRSEIGLEGAVAPQAVQALHAGVDEMGESVDAVVATVEGVGIGFVDPRRDTLPAHLRDNPHFIAMQTLTPEELHATQMRAKRRSGEGGRIQWPFKDMVEGQRFTVGPALALKAQHAVHAYSHHSGKLFATRRNRQTGEVQITRLPGTRVKPS